ncbi:MAG: FtsW/RodA/SpoVE family cell cycle protein [Tepidisphaerales bacterium]
MNRIWRQLAIASNWPILVAVLVLTAIGIVSIQAHSGADPHAAADAKKQLLFAAIGFGVMLAMQAVSYLAIGRFAWPFYILSLASLIYTVMPGVPTGAFLGVPEIKGQRNWINAGPLKLQPAELMKVAFCMVMARYLRFRSNYRTLGGLIPPFLLAVVPLMVILKQPDLGTAILFIPALFAMLFVAGARLRHLLAIVGIGLVLMPIAWYSGPREDTGLDIEVPILKHLPALVKKYQRARVYSLFSRDPAILRNTGYQQEQAVTAFGSGGFSGKGALNIPVGRTVPEAHNDMVFALIGEQFGFIGAVVTLAAYLVLFTTGVEIAANTREPFGKLVAVGTVSLLAGQTFMNIMVAQRLMPVTGITLPFVSYGGSSLLASFIAAGLLLNIGQNRPLVMANDAFEFD